MKKTMSAKSAPAIRKAYSYVRFSSPEQLKGDSLRRQLSLSAGYAKRHGFVVDESLKLQDLGVSAYKGKHLQRGALGGFLKAIENGQVLAGSVLLVEALDRISRQEPWDAIWSLFARF